MLIIEPIITSLPNMCVTVLATLAITLIFKTSYTTNFAQGVISALGCYVVSDLFFLAGWKIYFGLPVGILAGIAAGLFIDIVIFRRGKNVNAIGKQIITMGLVSVFYGALSLIYREKAANNIKFGYFSERVLSIGELRLSVNTLICVAITVVIVAAVFVCLYFTKWGLGVRATASNEFVADMLGVNTHAITAISWALAGALGAVAATIFATIPSNINYPLFLTSVQVNAFMAGILGGFSTFFGPVLAAIIIPLATILVRVLSLVDGFNGLTSWVDAVVYVLILLVILAKPQGLFGKRMVKKV